jgi:flavodoxin
MKKILLLAAVLILAAACTQKKTSKYLVLYYSQTANTKAVAEQIANSLGADIEAIECIVPYDGDFNATIQRSQKERAEGVLPEIKPLSVDVNAYDVIFLGYPIWFGTYAPPVASLLENVDLNGKKIVPFCTFGSGGLDSSVKDLKAKLPEAEILPGYGVRTARIEAVPAEVERFLKVNGLLAGDFSPLPDFSEARPVTEEESALFDTAVGDYPMIRAKAEEVASRAVPGGMEYIFTAKDLPMGPAPDAEVEAPAHFIKVYVLAEDGKAPVFTQVLR